MDAKEDNRPRLEEIRTRIQELRHEIEELRKVDQQQRLSRQSQVSWDGQKQHEARIARMDEIKEELAKLGRGMPPPSTQFPRQIRRPKGILRTAETSEQPAFRYHV